MRKIKFLLIAFIFIFVVVLTGCGSAGETQEENGSQLQTESNKQINKNDDKKKDEKENTIDKDSNENEKENNKNDDKNEEENQNASEKSGVGKSQEQTNLEKSNKSTETTKGKTNVVIKHDTSKGSNPSKSSKSEVKNNNSSNNKTSSKTAKKESNNNRLNSSSSSAKQPTTPPKKSEVKKEQTVTVSVSIPNGVSKGSGLAPTQVIINDGDSVLDATKKTGLDMNISGSGSMAYVRGINGLKEFDEGPLSGWMVKVDGVYIDRSAGAFKAANNQKIEWIYTTDYTN